jgi:tRNA(Arg) A34 adenosine deaminase TadA
MGKALVAILVLITAALLASSKWYLKNRDYKLTDTQTTLLNRLGDTALAHGDMPIAALLVYDNDIIATGYNDVKQHNNITGHAEINAIANAVQQIGADSFARLDRNKLQLITTWEPCYMCEGALIQYSIYHVVAIKPKSLKHWWEQWEKKEKYQWYERVATPDTLQDHLFKMHPQYEQQKNNL